MRTFTSSRWVEVFVSRRFQGATFETYKVNPKNRALYDAAAKYADSFTEETTKGLILSGTVGVGKTHLAVAIGRRLAERGFWPYWRSMPKVISEIRASWKGQGTYSEGMIKAPLMTAYPLIIDDLGAEMRDSRDQGWLTELIYEIVDARYEAMLPTIITTNMHLADIEDRYTERVASRLAEMCDVVWVAADDYRTKRGD